MIKMTEEEFIQLMLRRPKVALRRIDNPVLICAVNEFRFNWKRSKQYFNAALENVRRVLRRGI